MNELLVPIRRRGPDDEGICLISRPDRLVRSLHSEGSSREIQGRVPSYLDRDAWIPHDLALLQTRYAVLDPSVRSHQPFMTRDGSVVVAFQGEVFNYLELRKELEGLGLSFRSTGDAEVLAHAFQAWGDASWERLNGIWAAAVFDRRSARLVLCRDRCGIAPLFLSVSQKDRVLLFGSSVLGLGSFGPRPPSPNRARVYDFVETGLKDFDEETLFEGVWSLKPGTFLSLPLGAWHPSDGQSSRYWSLPTERFKTSDLSLGEAAGLLRDTLCSSIEHRLRADLPVAFQLSGGLDSASVVALAAGVISGPVPTYTVSVPEQDEEPLARRMTRRFSLESHVLLNPEAGLAEGSLEFAKLMEEPVQGPGAYGHHLLCEGVKKDGFGVVISGSGGDEVLAGYEWDHWPAARSLLMSEGKVGQALLYQAFLRYGSWRRARESLAGWARWATRLPSRALFRRVEDGEANDRSLPAGLTSEPGHLQVADRVQASFEDLDFDGRQEFRFRVADLPYYLASNDKATLGIPIEHRQPFLDHRVVELGFRMPVSYLFHKGWTKYVLRKAMEPSLPKEILWRREKDGFPFPTRRFLEANWSTVTQYLNEVTEGGYCAGKLVSAPTILEVDPNRLWRIFSVGSWLEALGMYEES